jgi:choline-sulfatase
LSGRPPNVLFVLTDQQRADSLGVLGGVGATPTFDALAGEGALFTSCMATSPVCVPSRFSLMSGWYPHNLGVQENRAVTLPVSVGTWVGTLRARGYRTAMFGKNHLHPEGGDLRRSVGLLHRLGFDDVDEVGGPRVLQSCRANITDLWETHGLLDAYRHDVADRLATTPWVARPSPLGPDLYYDAYVARQAAAYLRAYDRDQPWCCYVGFPGPHEPWDAPEPWASSYDPAAMAPATPAPMSVAVHPEGELERRLAAAPAPEPKDVAALRANYAGSVALIDSLVGELLDTVRARGEWDDTIVVVTSDHGELNGDAGLLYKEVFLDGAVRVPLIVRDPSTEHAGRVDGPVELLDVAATVLDLAGALEGGEFRKSVSLGDVVRGRAESPPRADALSEFRGEVMLATSGWKIALNAAGETCLLFERGSPEIVNRAGDPALSDVQEELEGRLLRRLVAASSDQPVFGPPPGLRAQLRAVLDGLGSEVRARTRRSRRPKGP